MPLGPDMPRKIPGPAVIFISTSVMVRMKNLWHRLLLSGAGNRITKDPAVQGEPQARGDRIVRIDTRSNPGYDPDPYFYYPALDLPTPIGKPVTTRGWARYDGAKLTPGFTSNATGGSSPPAVNFTGLTPGNLTGRFRDFGEAMSQVRKPARTYPRPGSCMTSLTVPNAPGSGTLSRSGCITVTQGIIPLPGFAGPPAVPDSDGKHLDLTGDGRAGWNDVVVIFTKTGWIGTRASHGYLP